MMTNPKPTIPEVRHRFMAYLATHGAWGSLHIVLDDDNVDDDSVRFCIDCAEQVGDTEGANLARILLQMSKTQRSKLARLNLRECTPFDFAYLLDQELNIVQSGLTLEQAATKLVPLEYRELAMEEYRSWQRGKETA